MRVDVTRLLVAALVALLPGLPGCAPGADGNGGGDGRPTRLVLVTLDTLRWDAFAGGPQAPVALAGMSALSREGLVFEQHFTSSSTTQPTHASLFTGLHPWEHGVVRNGVVLEGAPTVAEVLSEAGWWTGAAVASFPVTSRFGFGRGFAEFDEQFEREYVERWNDEVLEDAAFYRLAGPTLASAHLMLDVAPSANQFLWVHLFDPHEPYGDTGTATAVRRADVIKRVMRRRGDDDEQVNLSRMKRLYREDVASLDEELTAFVENLMADDGFQTHLIVTADHGESLGEDGALGHGRHLTSPEIHVPLLVFSEGLAPGRRVDPCGSADVFPTLLGLAGVPAPPSSGRDLLAEAPESPIAMGMRRSFEEAQSEMLLDGQIRRIVGHRFYFIEGERIVRGNSEALSVEGPALSSTQEEGLRKLFGTLEASVESLDSTEILDAETQEALRSLGYAR